MFQASMFCNRQSLCDSCKFRSRSNILSIYLSIYQSIYISIYPSIHPSIHPSIGFSTFLTLKPVNSPIRSPRSFVSTDLYWACSALPPAVPAACATPGPRVVRSCRPWTGPPRFGLRHGAGACPFPEAKARQGRMAAMGNPLKMKAFWWEKNGKNHGNNGNNHQ